MDKNVAKNIAIIVLVIFLCFSVVVNVFYVVKNQSLIQKDSYVFSGKPFQRNATASDMQFKPVFGEIQSSALDGYLAK